MKGKLEFGRAAWFVPAFFLNILFLGTSHVLSRLPIQYWALYVYIIVNLSLVFQGDIQTFYDVASLTLALLTFGLAFMAFHGQGWRRALLRSLQVISITFLPLGVEIFLFDYPEWNLHVTEFQATYSFAQWFTNADLFFTMVAVLGLTVFLSHRTTQSRTQTASHPERENPSC